MSKRVIGGYVFQQILNQGRDALLKGFTALNMAASENIGPQMRAAQFVKVGMALNELTLVLTEIEQYAR